MNKEKKLDQIQQPNDIKQYTNEALDQLAQEIRDFLIESVSKTGGHFASNLGIVELTLGLHYVLESPKDKIIWDVGHQAYVHKLLTGRKDDFATLRQKGGLSGFPKRCESQHDHFETGHSSTSISAALGIARARDINQDEYKVVAVIGDGALTGGMAFEALNDAGHTKTNMTVVLNDNHMSIADNVGAMSSYLSSIRTNKKYLTLKHEVEEFLYKIPLIGKFSAKRIEKLKKTIKYVLIPGILFEEMGFTYIGPIDGHNIKLVKKALKQATDTIGPSLVHIKTIKGKGYEPAEQEPTKYHGVSGNKAKVKSLNARTYSHVFGDTLCEMAKKEKNIVAISAAMPDGTGLSTFKDHFPKQFFDVGIAEQHAVTLAAGMATQGIKPYVGIYSTFMQRAYDQIIHDVCLQNLPVTFAIDRAGLVGEDGPTHHGVFDLSFLTHMPNMTVLSPADVNELREMLHYSLGYDGPMAIRYPKGTYLLPDVQQDYGADVLKWPYIKKEKGPMVVIATGRMVQTALQSHEKLKQMGLSVSVVNARSIKPMDEKMLIELSQQYQQIITIEDNVAMGGLGSHIALWINQNRIKVNHYSMAIHDEFVEHGNVDELFASIGLDEEHLTTKIIELSNLGERHSQWQKNALMH